MASEDQFKPEVILPSPQFQRSNANTYFIRRFATASALAASSSVPLLQARGHQISNVSEVPLVISSKAFEGAAIVKTSAAVALLKAVGAGPDLSKVKASRKLYIHISGHLWTLR